MRFLKVFWSLLNDKNHTSQFLILISFLVTFIIARAVTYLQKLNIIPNQTALLHIHHLVPGIFLLLISGYIGLSFWIHGKVRHIAAVLFGIGAALTIDEFALWLYLKDVYWDDQGRISVDAVIITAIVLGLLLLIGDIYDYYRKNKK